MSKKKTNEECIRDFRKIYGDFYDYSKFVNINAHTNSIMICPIHGEFKRTPNDHMNGRGCPICGEEKRRLSRMNTLSDVIERANIVHHNKYIYTKSIYKGEKNEMCIICPIHGEFWQRPDHHLQGSGCQECALEKLSQLFSDTTDDFIEKSHNVHGNTYIYNKTDLNNRDEKGRIIITCRFHGDFKQTPTHHLQGQGCPICNTSHLEQSIRKVLLKNEIDFIQQKKFDWLGLQSLDFYLPKHNIAIECQGIQHFRPIRFFGGEQKYYKTSTYDKQKYDLCKENGIKLFYFTKENDLPLEYYDKIYTNEEELLNEIILYKKENIIS